MKLPQISIQNTQFVLILVLILGFLGVRSFISMPRSEDPNLELPVFNIVAVYPGTNTLDMEELVLDPLEDVLEEIEDIQRISAEVQTGLVTILMEGEYDIDFEDKYDEIVREVNTVRPTLPEGIVYFDINQFAPKDRNSIQQYALVSEDVPYHQLYDMADDLKDRLAIISSIKDIQVEASPEEQIVVSLDFQRMASQGIALQQVVGILQASNANVPGGNVNAQSKSFSITTTGGFKNLDEIRNMVISAAGGKVVYLKDIASVEMGYEDIRWMLRHNSQRGVLVSMKLKAGENILLVQEEIEKIAAEFEQGLPPQVQMASVFSQAPAVEARINEFFVNLFQGVLLVGIIILIFLGWRPSLIIMTIIPLVILMALAGLNMMDFGLQQISISSLVLALGLLVDNGIVVVENIQRYLKDGYSLKEAAAKGTGEVGYAIISSTVTTLLAFFPLTQLGEGAGVFLKSLPLTVMGSLIISLILALTLSPILASKILKVREAGKVGPVTRFMDSFIERVYRPILNFSLKRGWLVVLVAVLLSAGSVSLFPKIGVSFFPTADKPMLLIEIDAPNGTSIDGTDLAVRYVESVLDTIDFVKNYTANVGHGHSQVYYNRIPSGYVESHGQVLVNFKEWNPTKFYQTLENLRQSFEDYPAAKITFSELKNGAPFNAPVEILIIGEDLTELKRLAFEVEDVLLETSGLINVNNPLGVDKTELKLKLNREKAGMMNLSYLDFDQTIRASMAGLRITQTSLEDGEEYPIVVRMPFDEEPGIEDFNKVYFTTRTGGQVPLRQVASVEFKASSAEILHRNLQRHATVTAGVIDADQTVPLTQQVLDKLEAVELPAGYRIMAGGEYEDQQSTFGSLGVILMLAQIAIFAVLVLQFRSVLQPLIVFSAIPLAASGSFVALYLTGWPFSFFAFVGLISLVGIVVNNSIIMVDYINQLRDQGTPLLDAIKQGSERRFLPIVLTTMTTILGLLPITASISNQWSPLGWTIIGGMISSTILTLVMVPVLYKWLTRE